MLNKITSNKIYSSSKRQGDVDYTKPGQHGKGKQNPNFTGALDMAMVPLQWFEQNPMLNVSLLDCSTAIFPRTYQESKTNAFAGFEAFRRESSGLIVNCLIPSFIVLGAAKLLSKPIFGRKTNLYKCWANEDTTKLVSSYWNGAEGTGKEKISKTIKDIINDTKGIGDNSGKEKAFKELIDYDKLVEIDKHGNKKSVNQLIDDLADAIVKQDVKKKNTDALYNGIMQHTHISESIKLGKQKELYTGTAEEIGKQANHFFGINFKSLLRDATGLLNEFVDQKAYTKEAVDSLSTKAIKLINRKSALGLGFIIPLALSMQPINRFITEKISGHKGAPIYKDFATKDNKPKELTPKQNHTLWMHKILGSAAMIGVALLSMKSGGGKLNKKVLQFSGIFPTMDQARVISTATFVSRIMSSQDSNDCREATIRDIGTFSALYFLGDYAARAVASLIEKVSRHKVSLLNASEAADTKANMFQKLKHWATSQSLKSTEEVLDKKAKNLRSVCQLGNILFSFVLLGTIIPKVTRHLTDKHHEAEMKKSGMTTEEISKYYQNYPKNATSFGASNSAAAYRPFTATATSGATYTK